MNEIAKQVIVGIVVLVIGSLFGYFGFLKEKTELKYTISESINLNKNNDTSVSVQQLRISNTGDLPITRIEVKIKSKIIDYNVQKDKDSDSITFKEKSNFTLIEYIKLPKGSEFFVNFSTNETDKIKNNIEIKYDGGKPIEAFTEEKPDTLLSTLLLIASMIIIILTIFSIFSSEKGLKVFIIDYYAMEKILKRPRPFYIFKKRWLKIREDSLKFAFAYDYNSDIEKTECYIFLTKTKNEYFTDDEWSTLKERAEEKLKELIIKSIIPSYKYGIGEPIYNLSKPKYCSDTSWQSIINKMSELYHIGAVNYAIYWNTPAETKELLSEKKPNTITEEYWAKIKKSLEDIYTYKIVSNGTKWSVLDKYLKEIDLSILSDEIKEQIEKIFSEIMSGKENKENYSWLAHHIKLLPYQNELMEKPANISEKDWEEFIEIHNTFVKVKNDTEKALKTIERENLEITPLRIQVTKQLEIIDNLLKDPKTIDKIEEYNKPFSTGNWENLIRIKDILINK